MTKPTSPSTFSLASALAGALLAGSLLAGSLCAQRAPLPGLPLVPPAVPQPGLAAQPLFDNGQKAPTPRPTAGTQPTKSAKKPGPPPETRGVQIAGRDLKRAVDKVKALPWHRRLASAKTEARKTDRPILLLQTLGDIGGFA